MPIDLATFLMMASSTGGGSWSLSGLLSSTAWTRESLFGGKAFTLEQQPLSPDRQDPAMNIFKRRLPPVPTPTPERKEPTMQTPPGTATRIDYSSLQPAPDPAKATTRTLGPDPAPAAPEKPPEPSRLRAEESRPEPAKPPPAPPVAAAEDKPGQAVALDELAAELDGIGGNVNELIRTLNTVKEYAGRVTAEKDKLEQELALMRKMLVEERADWEVERAAWAAEREAIEASTHELARRLYALKSASTPTRKG